MKKAKKRFLLAGGPGTLSAVRCRKKSWRSRRTDCAGRLKRICLELEKTANVS